MKISTKIILGYALLILLLVTSLVYELSLIRRMQSINRSLSNIKTRAAQYTLYSRDIEQLGKNLARSYVTADPDYFDQVREMSKRLSEDLAKIQASVPTPGEQRQLENVKELWDRFSGTIADQEALFRMTPEQVEAWIPSEVKMLQSEIEQALRANQQATDAEVGQSARAGQRAEQVSQMAAIIALGLSCLISYVVVRSISKSLERLTHGARAVAQGQFSYRIDASGDDNFSKVARDFNFMVSRLDQMDQLKRDYVSHVSHELKAPLAAIQETSKLVREGIAGPVTDKQKHLLGLSIECGDRLSKTIRSLLDVSRMEADALDYELEKLDVRELVRAAVAEFEIHFSQDNRSLRLELPDTELSVECDRDRVIQVLTNLLDNALKFSPANSPLEVRAERLKTKPTNLPASWSDKVGQGTGGFVLVTVADSGRGVPDEHKEQIFEKFHQVKFGKKVAGQGVGLGLVICRNIVQAHGGAIWVEDNREAGSVFSVLLPSVAEHPVTGEDLSGARRALGRVQPA